MDCSRPGFPALHYLPEFAQTEPVILSNHLIFCCPILLLPSIFLSISIFPSKSALCIRWPKYWNSNFNISASNQYSRLISFRIDWFVLLTKSPRDSQESFTAPQFEIISSLVLSLLYDTTHSLELESNLIPCLQDIWPCVCVCVCVCVWGLVAQLCPTLCDPVDSTLLGSFVHRILQARIPEWVASPFPRGSSRSRDKTWASHIAGRFFTIWATKKALGNSTESQIPTYFCRFSSVIASFILSLHPFASNISPQDLCTYCFLFLKHA